MRFERLSLDEFLVHTDVGCVPDTESVLEFVQTRAFSEEPYGERVAQVHW